MIHLFVGSHVKKPESGLFSDWIGNNTDDLRCSDWPKCRLPLAVVDFSLHFCLRNEECSLMSWIVGSGWRSWVVGVGVGKCRG